jgi:hypothetical protein
MQSKNLIGLRVRFALSLDADLHRHALECISHPNETAGHGHDLPNIARNRDRDQIEAADTVVRRIEGNPARAPALPTTSWSGL